MLGLDNPHFTPACSQLGTFLLSNSIARYKCSAVDASEAVTREVDI